MIDCLKVNKNKEDIIKVSQYPEGVQENRYYVDNYL